MNEARRRAVLLRFVPTTIALILVLTSCGILEGGVEVPDVRGIRYARARGELRELGFDVRRKLVEGSQPANTVVRQSIRPGRTVTERDVIRLIVSDGTLVAEEDEDDVPTDAGSFADVFSEVSEGVMRVETTACEEGGHGTGFLIAPNLVVTAGHVVADGVSIVVSGAGDVSSGHVIGLAREDTDVALVQTDNEFAGHVFEFVDELPPAGTEAAVIGYPVDESLSIVDGTISGLDRIISVRNWGRVTGAIQTDSAINPGNSGGPMVDLQGRVIGLAEAEDPESEGIAYAVNAEDAEPQLQQWIQNPEPPEVPECEAPVGPGSVAVRSDVAHPHLAELLDTFQSYFDGINFGHYRLAYQQLAPDRPAFPTFRQRLLSSYDFDVSIRSIEEVDATHDEVLVTFWSVQEPEFGPDKQSCTKWTLNYSMVYSGERWFIDDAQEHGEDGSVAC